MLEQVPARLKIIAKKACETGAALANSRRQMKPATRNQNTKGETMKTVESLKRNDLVTLVRDAKTLANTFKAGDQFKFLGIGTGSMLRLSRVGDRAKLLTTPDWVGYVWAAQVEEQRLRQVPARITSTTKYDAPHADESGSSRRIVVATVLAGKDSGELAMHLTPAEEREYNAGMARLAELG